MVNVYYAFKNCKTAKAKKNLFYSNKLFSSIR